MITFKCPSCQREARAADEHAGKRAKCPKCNHVFAIPSPGEAAKPAKSAASPPAKTKPTTSNGAPKAAPPVPKAAMKKAPPPPPPDYEEVEDDEEEEDVADAVAAEEDEEEPVEDQEEDLDEEEDEEEERPRKKKKPKKSKRKYKGREGAWAPCPRCGETDATKQYFTWWGGFMGPLIINTVRCNDCGTTYNGIHGDYNTNRILIYCLVPLGIVIVLFGGCGVLGALMNL